MTRRLLFTVDLDRDVNFAVEGRTEAGSLDRGQGIAPRFSSAEKGLALLLGLLDEMGIKATFFVEGRTSEVIDCSVLSGHCIGFHGYDHEDMALVPDLASVMDRGYRAVSDNVARPVCFRAPYMSMDDRIYAELQRLGIRHDSSVYASPTTPAYDVSGITEHPVAKGKDGTGKTIFAYLWPLHEGRRVPSDYIGLIRSCGDGDIVLATHTWHIVERRESGLMSHDDIAQNLDGVRQVLASAMDAGYRPAVITEGT